MGDIVNIGATASEVENSATWTPREALLGILRLMDSECDLPEGSEIDACVAVYTVKGAGGVLDVRFRNAASDVAVSLGMLEIAKQLMLRDGED